MDKFCNFVMTPRKEQPTTQSRKIKKTYIQTKLNDCPGVVVIKDLVKAKQILEDLSCRYTPIPCDGSDLAVVIACLRSLVRFC